MTLGDFGAIGGIVAGIVAIVGALWVIFSFYSKVNRIDRSVKALVLIHTTELIEFYKKTSASLFNPVSSPERDTLLDKLERGILTMGETNRLKQILKEEETEAIRKNQHNAALAIAALLLHLNILSKEK